MLYFPKAGGSRINIKYHILSSQLVNYFSLLVTCPGGWVCRCTSSPCWDCPCSRPPRPWRIGPRWQPSQWGKKHILAFCFRHLLFKMSMRLLLKIGPLKVLSRVENFLCMIVGRRVHKEYDTWHTLFAPCCQCQCTIQPVTLQHHTSTVS